MSDKTVRVIVHAGFHKTGTSSLQDYLRQNRRALNPYLAFYGKADFLKAGANARRYGQRPFPWRMWAFRRSLRRFLGGIPDAPLIVLSRETFGGAMPGHRDWRGHLVSRYSDRAVPLLQTVKDELYRRFGPAVQIEILFTTREREDWLRSIYGHLVRSIHLTETYPQFRASFPDLVDLEVEARRIGRALIPCQVHTARLEETGPTRAGPATAVLDLAGVPAKLRQRLPAAERANVGQPPEIEAKFLELNRSGRSKAELKTIKDQMLQEARKP